MGKDLVSEHVNINYSKSGGFQQDPFRFRPIDTFRNCWWMKFIFLRCFCSPFVNKKHPRWENSTRGLLGWTLDASCWQSMESRCGGRSGEKIHNHSVSQIAMGCNDKFLVRDFLMGKPSRIQKWTMFHCHVWWRGQQHFFCKTQTWEFHQQILGVNTHGTGRWRPTATYPCGWLQFVVSSVARGLGLVHSNVLDSIHVFWVLQDHRLS